MKILAVFLLCVICLFTISATSQRSTPEYRFVYQCDEKKTNGLAAEGWELTDMSMASYGSMGVATCVFKRNK